MNDDRNTLSRREDPDTSHEGARRFDRVSAMAYALQCVEWRPRSTSKELEAYFSPQGDGEIRKRLNDLRLAGEIHKGEKRRCEITGRTAYTWLPGPEPAGSDGQIVLPGREMVR